MPLEPCYWLIIVPHMRTFVGVAAALAGGQLFGFLGILLALRIASELIVVVRHAHGHCKSSVLVPSEVVEVEEN